MLRWFPILMISVACFLTVACHHSGSYRYIDQKNIPPIAHRAVTSSASNAGLHKRGKPKANGAEKSDRFVWPSRDKRPSAKNGRSVEIRTYRRGNGSRTEVSSERRFSLDISNCGGCRQAVTFEVEGTREQSYNTARMLAISIFRLSVVDGFGESILTADTALRLPYTLWTSTSGIDGPHGRHRLRLFGSLGIGWDFVRESEDSDTYSPAGLRFRPGVTLAYIYDRVAVPIPQRLLTLSWWALHTELSAEPLMGGRSGVDFTLSFNVQPFGGLFVRAGYQTSPESGATWAFGIEGGSYPSYLVVAFAAAIPLLYAFGAIGDPIRSVIGSGSKRDSDS